MNNNLNLSEKTQWRILITFLCLCIVILSVRLVQYWLIDVCLVPTDSMENAIMAGDRLIVRKTRNVNRHDVIIFNHPNGSNDQLVKRCIGLPGDTVGIVRSAIYINGKINIAIPTVRKSSYDFKVEFPLRTLEWDINNFGPVVTPIKGLSVPLDSTNMNLYFNTIQFEGEKISCKDNIFYIGKNQATDYTFNTNSYFVLGDNRGNSLDSRHFGFVSEELIVGKVLMVYFSRDVNRRSIRWERVGLIVK